MTKAGKIVAVLLGVVNGLALALIWPTIYISLTDRGWSFAHGPGVIFALGSIVTFPIAGAFVGWRIHRRAIKRRAALIVLGVLPFMVFGAGCGLQMLGASLHRPVETPGGVVGGVARVSLADMLAAAKAGIPAGGASLVHTSEWEFAGSGDPPTRINRHLEIVIGDSGDVVEPQLTLSGFIEGMGCDDGVLFFVVGHSAKDANDPRPGVAASVVRRTLDALLGLGVEARSLGEPDIARIYEQRRASNEACSRQVAELLARPAWKREREVAVSREAKGGDGPATGAGSGGLTALKTMKLLWEAPGVFVDSEAPVPFGDGLLVATDGHKRELVAIDVRTGTTRWRVELPGRQLGGVAVAGGLVLVHGHEGQLSVLDGGNGAVRWSRDVGCLFMSALRPTRGGLAGICSPLGSRIFHRRPRETIAVAFDATSGRELWRQSMPDPFAELVDVDADGVYTVTARPLSTGEPPGPPGYWLMALDGRSGKERWRAPLEGPSEGGVIAGSLVVTVGPIVAATRIADGRLAWTFKTDGRLAWTSNVLGSAYGILPHTGTSPAGLSGQPLVADGALIMLRAGELAALDLGSGRITRSWPVEQIGKDADRKMAGIVGDGTLAVWTDPPYPNRGDMESPVLDVFQGSERTRWSPPTTSHGAVGISRGTLIVRDSIGDKPVLRGYQLGEPGEKAP